MAEATQVLLYALVAGFSPLALLSILAVISGGNGRGNGSAFAIGFLLGQSLMLVASFALGSVAVPSPGRGHPTLTASLELLLGVALLLFGWQGRRPRDQVELSGESRTSALLARLRSIRARTAFSVGLLLGIGGIKRLTLTLLAGTTIAVSGLSTAEQVGLAVAYVLIATLLVWVPASMYLVAGSRADSWNASMQAWLTANQRRATALSTVVFGLILTVHGLISLLLST
ncbi:MAG TPA: GAP family protein [Gaiellaceae bacterium]|nr:GAP family protein [Gaiellaceae bacterium]